MNSQTVQVTTALIHEGHLVKQAAKDHGRDGACADGALDTVRIDGLDIKLFRSGGRNVRRRGRPGIRRRGRLLWRWRRGLRLNRMTIVPGRPRRHLHLHLRVGRWRRRTPHLLRRPRRRQRVVPVWWWVRRVHPMRCSRCRCSWCRCSRCSHCSLGHDCDRDRPDGWLGRGDRRDDGPNGLPDNGGCSHDPRDVVKGRVVDAREGDHLGCGRG